jgi:hypothetical protein
LEFSRFSLGEQLHLFQVINDLNDTALWGWQINLTKIQITTKKSLPLLFRTFRVGSKELFWFSEHHFFSV